MQPEWSETVSFQSSVKCSSTAFNTLVQILYVWSQFIHHKILRRSFKIIISMSSTSLSLLWCDHKRTAEEFSKKGLHALPETFPEPLCRRRTKHGGCTSAIMRLHKLFLLSSNDKNNDLDLLLKPIKEEQKVPLILLIFYWWMPHHKANL